MLHIWRQYLKQLLFWTICLFYAILFLTLGSFLKYKPSFFVLLVCLQICNIYCLGRNCTLADFTSLRYGIIFSCRVSNVCCYHKSQLIVIACNVFYTWNSMLNITFYYYCYYWVVQLLLHNSTTNNATTANITTDVNFACQYRCMLLADVWCRFGLLKYLSCLFVEVT